MKVLNIQLQEDNFLPDDEDILHTRIRTSGIREEKYVFEDDEIIVSEMEHHANLIPWQQLAKRSGAELKWFGVTADGRLDESNIDSLITSKTKIVAITQQSNVLETINNLDCIQIK